jgi:hypothetical protein
MKSTYETLIRYGEIRTVDWYRGYTLVSGITFSSNDRKAVQVTTYDSSGNICLYRVNHQGRLTEKLSFNAYADTGVVLNVTRIATTDSPTTTIERRHIPELGRTAACRVQTLPKKSKPALVLQRAIDALIKEYRLPPEKPKDPGVKAGLLQRMKKPPKQPFGGFH